MGQEMSLLKEAREIIRTQPMDIRVGHLRSCADQLQENYDILCVSCTREASHNFVAAFTRTLLAIEKVHAHIPPTPSGGRLSVPLASEETRAKKSDCKPS